MGGGVKKSFVRLVRLYLSGHGTLAKDCEECKQSGEAVDLGCYPGTVAASPIVTKGGMLRFEYCPKRWALEQPDEFNDLYRDYVRAMHFKRLPDPGGINDQDPVFLEACDAIEEEISIRREVNKARG